MAPVKSPRERRFAFGANWSRYLALVDETRVQAAERSLTAALGPLSGRSFLDVGSGSGLFSLAARRLGAEVVSFDFDPQAVNCAVRLRERFSPDDPHWRVGPGSALDSDFMNSLGEFDIVYSWGVLHHTGKMWDALRLTCERVRPDGQLFIALYNDQGRASKYWRVVKRTYNTVPPSLRPLLVGLTMARWIPSMALGDMAKRKNPLARYRDYGARARGMSVWHDWIDWIGGYPFEVAQPGDVFNFLRDQGFQMLSMQTTADLGCNEFVAQRQPVRAGSAALEASGEQADSGLAAESQIAVGGGL